MAKVLRMLRRGRDGLHVGTVVYSPYFGRHLAVTRYVNDRTWWFKFAERDSKKEYRAQTPLTHFMKD